jgi:hypothetical protein
VQEKAVDLQKITEMKRKIFVPSKKNRRKSLTSQKKMNVKIHFNVKVIMVGIFQL